jgi:membrane associated rhomboid family serine protease
MLFLFITGDDVERRTGHLLYPVFYIACGAAATAASYVHGSAPGVPHVGASGAVAGTMGAYLVFCYYKSLCFRWWWRLIVLPSWIYLLFWVATQVLFMQLGEGRIDYAAHVGGFAFGAVTAGILSALQTYNPYTGDWQWRFFRSAAAGS